MRYNNEIGKGDHPPERYFDADLQPFRKISLFFMTGF